MDGKANAGDLGVLATSWANQFMTVRARRKAALGVREGTISTDGQATVSASIDLHAFVSVPGRTFAAF